MPSSPVLTWALAGCSPGRSAVMHGGRSAVVNHRIGLIVDELPKGDQVAAGLIFTGAVAAQNVSAWRTLGDYQPDPDESHPHELATAAYTTAVAAAAASAAGYAADKMANLHGRRVVNDSIDVLTGELHQLAVTIDIATSEPPTSRPRNRPQRRTLSAQLHAGRASNITRAACTRARWQPTEHGGPFPNPHGLSRPA